MPFIANLPYPLLQREVCRMITKLTFKQGDVIYTAGDRASVVYVVGTGSVGPAGVAVTFVWEGLYWGHKSWGGGVILIVC